jgi:hypothetical protein
MAHPGDEASLHVTMALEAFARELALVLAACPECQGGGKRVSKPLEKRLAAKLYGIRNRPDRVMAILRPYMEALVLAREALREVGGHAPGSVGCRALAAIDALEVS